MQLIISRICSHSSVKKAGPHQQKIQSIDFRNCRYQTTVPANTNCQKITVIKLQNSKGWGMIEFDCSDPFYALDDCKKCSETVVGKQTEWKLAVFTVEIFAM